MISWKIRNVNLYHYLVIWRATNWDKEEAKDRRGGTRGNNHNQDDNRAGRRDN